MALTLEGSRSTAIVSETPATRQSRTVDPPTGSEVGAFSKVFHGLASNLEQGERTIERVRHGGSTELGATELLALQAEVYRYSEAVDLSAKLIDRATNGVKTVLQGQ